MRVPLQDLARQNGPLTAALHAAFAKVVASGQFIQGPEVEAFERELAAFVGTRFVVAVSSGTDALLACLMALEVRPGDEVVTTPYSFFASVGGILRLGARPVFVDVDEATFNLSAAAARAAVGPRTRALLPVHLFGRPAAVEPEAPVPVVEDAAQAVGAAPLKGIAQTYSFFPSKNLGGLGDGGAVATDDEPLARRLRLLRSHGAHPKYIHVAVGGNFRLDSLQAAALRVKLPHLPGWIVARRARAAAYRDLFEAAFPSGVPEDFVLPVDEPRHTYHQFVIRCGRREALRAFLAESGVGTEIYYPRPLHTQPCLLEAGLVPGALPVAERLARESLALPLFPELREEEQAYVVEQVRRFYAEGGRRW